MTEMYLLCSVPGAVYLSVEMQKELPYKLVNLLPYKSYARKNLGYLYAIQVRILIFRSFMYLFDVR